MENGRVWPAPDDARETLSHGPTLSEFRKDHSLDRDFALSISDRSGGSSFGITGRCDRAAEVGDLSRRLQPSQLVDLSLYTPRDLDGRVQRTHFLLGRAVGSVASRRADPVSGLRLADRSFEIDGLCALNRRRYPLPELLRILHGFLQNLFSS